MELRYFLFLFSASALFKTSFTAEPIYKICAFPSMTSDVCRALEVGNSQVSCTPVPDGVGCAMALKSKEADFAVINAEEAVLMSKMDDLVSYVVGDIVTRNYEKQQNSVEMVVLVRANITKGDFEDLRNKRYCHPGVSVSRHFTDKFLKSFENVVVPMRCKNDYSAVEQEVYNVNSFFGDSCRPGTWAQDDYVDGYLKRKFRKLCNLCDMPHLCQNQLHYSSPHKQALECLKNRGDIAFVSYQSILDDIKFYGQNYDDFRLLCQDKTLMSINSATPCAWSKQPWDLVVARSDVSDDLKKRLVDWLSPSAKSQADRWQKTLREMIVGDANSFRPQESKPIGQFIDRGAVDQATQSGCQKAAKWCTTNDLEAEKCRWLSLAAETHGIRPSIECVPSPNVLTCLELISKKKADAVSIDTDLGFIARAIYGLSTIVFEDNSHQGNYKILAVIKNIRTTKIRSFQDLRYKKACFPEYNGLGWLAFVNIAYEKNLLSYKQCPEKYFLNSCAPGANLNFLRPGQQPQPNLCSSCANGTCSPLPSRLQRNVNAMKCLDNDGDVAFINYESLTSGQSRLNSSIKTDDYSVLCRNGTIITGTLDVDSDCALATGIRAEIVGRKENRVSESLNLSELFLQLNNWFGTTSQTKEGVIRMFDKMKRGSNLLFKDTTIALVHGQVSSYDMINSYKELLTNVSKTCTGASNSLMPSFTLLLTVLLIKMFRN